MPEISNETYQPLVFDSIKIDLASPEKIREWSYGEVTKPETINYRSLKPEKGGLFCERIFGPTKDWECSCGKYKKVHYKGNTPIICSECGVEVTKSNVRRDRMGSIELVSPVSHIWYFKGVPSRMGLLLDITPKKLEQVLYFVSYVVTDKGTSNLANCQVLSSTEYDEAKRLCAEEGTYFTAEMGAAAIQKLLKRIDLDKEAAALREEIAACTTSQKEQRLVKKLEVVEAFQKSGNRPEWMVLDVLPVIPPDLRPMVQLDGGRFATSDLNDLYRRIINRNNRMRIAIQQGAPDLIIRNEKRMLQESVDSLFDNGRRGKPQTGPGGRALKSLSDLLKGKQGRFRQNLLGKRVDYSGRSVIVVGPELKIYQCGLPKEMAIELFKPFVMRELTLKKIATNIKGAKKMVERMEDSRVWDVLEEVIKEHPVMLNRAPTLHRLGIQAFEPILVEGKAIKLHPLVCTAFNADFDGDQMAVHLPLSMEAQAECRFMLLSPNNLLKPSDGAPVAVPSQDMVLGIYYLTQERPGSKGEGRYFHNFNEAVLAFENKDITFHSRINVRMTKTMPDGREVTGIVNSTYGRFLFNEIIPQDLGNVNRQIPGNELLLEIDEHVGKNQLKKILGQVINVHGATITAEVLDRIKAMGYKYSTLAALTVSVSDMIVPAEKQQMIEDTQALVDKIGKKKQRGLLKEEERYKAVIEAWKKTDDALTKKLLDNLDPTNNLKMMADSGARGSDKQIKQLAGMRGLMANTTGQTIELPIKSNFREGLDVLEYFISAHGARKGLSDTALRTADSGYLTRRLVDVSQEMIIREKDCCEEKIAQFGPEAIPYMEIKAITEGSGEKITVTEKLETRMRGRFIAESIYDPDTGERIVKANHILTPARVAAVMSAFARCAGNGKEGAEYEGPKYEITTGELNQNRKEVRQPRDFVKIRTILSCKCKGGICAKCYGTNMASQQLVQVGEAVGIIAAQSIGEPGTQLTMRTFHTGGVAGGDITQGLPRVEEIFEARRPKGMAIISDFAGMAEYRDTKKKREIVVTSDETGETKTYVLPYNSHPKRAEEFYHVEAGEPLTEGSVNPHDIIAINGVRAAQDYMIREVQKVYQSQSVDIADKHIEIIVRQMLRRVRIDEPGDSGYLTGNTMDFLDFETMNEELIAQGKTPAVGTRVLLGITKAALNHDSFLAAASFQETTKILTDAAIKGKIDSLSGLKENVIIGKLIPAGTGMSRYENVRLSTDIDIEREEAEKKAFDAAFAKAMQEAKN
ncbi:MAG: DNA-directed RNA polymerase subunit beta' [Lachnospiraceae bacterium]|jgi:DNA-directed RNA polymerase subunit beta'|nr:DNA-directed RNA polymerase subunit beta' [Lachnospiraceae bacterium]